VRVSIEAASASILGRENSRGEQLLVLPMCR